MGFVFIQDGIDYCISDLLLSDRSPKSQWLQTNTYHCTRCGLGIWRQRSYWRLESGDIAHTEWREDPIPRWQAQTAGKGLNSSLNRPPQIRLLECPHDTAADFSHIQTSKAKTGGDTTSLPIQAMGVIYLPLLGYWLDTLPFSVGEVSASPWTLRGVNVEVYSRGWVRSDPLNNSSWIFACQCEKKEEMPRRRVGKEESSRVLFISFYERLPISQARQQMISGVTLWLWTHRVKSGQLNRGTWVIKASQGSSQEVRTDEWRG